MSRDKLTKWGLRRALVHAEDEIHTLEAQIDELKRARDDLERMYQEQRATLKNAIASLSNRDG